jgi:DNA topoisomerase-1
VDQPSVIAANADSAKAAGLRYVSDSKPGIQRKRRGSGFRYVDAAGKPLHDKQTLARIKSLVIPPAWTDVWICPIPNGHLQATGRDARGRKQSRYHPRWRQLRDETKYEHMVSFGKALPRIRERVEHDLALSGLPRPKILATIVRLMETTYIRVGNQEYARQNKSYGLTTMRGKHVEVHGSAITFTFPGKSGVHHEIDLEDRRLAKIVRRCQDLPGYELFQYLDADGERHTVDSSDVNDYLREMTGQDFTAKDFRTWAGTVLTCAELQALEAFESETQAKKNMVQAIKVVSSLLGNTPSVCRKCYVHPAVLDCYMTGELLKNMIRRTQGEAAESLNALSNDEVAMLRFLSKRLSAS